MPRINVRLVQDVFTPDQKREIVERLTDAICPRPRVAALYEAIQRRDDPEALVGRRRLRRILVATAEHAAVQLPLPDGTEALAALERLIAADEPVTFRLALI